MNKTLLDGISIASPCSADWNQMRGDERRRFCASCNLYVHNLSGMTAAQATSFVAGAGGGRVCVRLFRRADGTVLTRDCPVGLRQRMRRAWAKAAALWLALWSGVSCGRGKVGPTPAPPMGAMQPVIPELPVRMGEMELGDMVHPPAQPQPAPHQGGAADQPAASMGRVVRSALGPGKVEAPATPPKK